MKLSNNGISSIRHNVSNKYLLLLKRLDEEEGLCEPSIDEKLKLAVSYISRALWLFDYSGLIFPFLHVKATC